MEDNRIVIKQVGYTYIFEMEASREAPSIVREGIKEQLKEGCVVLPPYVNLVSAEPHLETFLEEDVKKHNKNGSRVHEHNYDNCHNLTCKRRSYIDGYREAIDDMTGNLIRNSITEVIDGEARLIITERRIKQIAEKMKE